MVDDEKDKELFFQRCINDPALRPHRDRLKSILKLNHDHLTIRNKWRLSREKLRNLLTERNSE
jgi:hypothetical protein